MAEHQLAFQTYESRANQYSQQSLINLFWEKGQPGTKSEGITFRRPGLKAFATVGAGPIRGMHTMNGVPFVVSGPRVFTVDSAGAPTDLGEVGGTGLVDMNDNGFQVAIVSGQNGYIAVPFEELTTTLSIEALIGAVIITVVDRTDFAMLDIIKITLDDTSVFETTIEALEGDTTLSAPSVAPDTTPTVANEAGMTAGDDIFITLDDNSIFSTTIASLGPLTLDDPTTGDAASGNLVTFGNSGTVKIADAIAGDNAAIGNDVVVNTPTLRQITDENFRPVSSVTFQDGFFIWSEFDTQVMFSSPLLDGIGPYDPLNFASAEYDSDKIVRVFSDHDDLFAFGENTTEPWVAGGTAFPFVPNAGTVMEVGLAARNSVSKIDNSLMFFGNAGDRDGLSVWRIMGYSAQRVSTHALEAVWEAAGDVSDSYAITFRMEGHEFYVLTIPGTGTFVYDASTQMWTTWKTRNQEGWEAIGFSNAYNSKIVADFNGNGLFTLSMDFFDDDGDAILWEGITVNVAEPNGYMQTHKYLRIDMQTGVGLTTGQGSNPQIFLSWADEDEKFGNLHLLDVGKKGETKTRVQKWQLGQARSRVYKVQGSDPVFTAILGMYLETIPGVS